MIRFIKNMLSEGSEVSNKRVIGTTAFGLLAVAFILNIFWNIKVSDKLVDVMELIVMSCVGATAVEKFAPKVKEEE